MNCARVLNTHPQSTELAEYLKGQYLCQLLNMYPVKPIQHYELPVYSSERISPRSKRLTSSPTPSLSQEPPYLRSCFRKNSTGVNKKHVVFADDKGLVLTTVHLFTPESFSSSSSSDQVQGPSLACLEDQQLNPNNSLRKNLLLGFLQPGQDFTHLRDRRQVQSHNISRNTPNGLPGFTPLWDNKGQNYKVCMEKDGSNHDQVSNNRFYSTLSKYRPYACQQAPLCLKKTDLPKYSKLSLSSRYKAELSPSA